MVSLKEENDELRGKVDNLTAEVTDLKSQNEALKTSNDSLKGYASKNETSNDGENFRQVMQVK